MTKVGAALWNMARTFDQVLADVTARSDPQRQIVLSQIADLPNQQAADEAGLEAKKTQAYDEILGGARRRGLGFSGIPVGEQAKYAATDYAPALANLKSSYGQRRGTLESALADMGRNDYNSAYDMFNQDRNFEEQQRQFNENMALQKRAASTNPYAGLFDGQGQGAGQQGSSTMSRRNDGGYNFTNQFGNPISAAQYAAAKGIPFRDLLGMMAQGGDQGAKTALGFVGNDFGYDARKVNTPELASLFNSLIWGTNARQAPLNPQGYSNVNGMRVPNF